MNTEEQIKYLNTAIANSKLNNKPILVKIYNQIFKNQKFIFLAKTMLNSQECYAIIEATTTEKFQTSKFATKFFKSYSTAEDFFVKTYY